MSTSRKPNSYRPGTSQKPLEPAEPMTFDERLARYANQPGGTRRPDGLTPRQYKRLIKKDRHLWQCSVAAVS
jgi:hypothetical protein